MKKITPIFFLISTLFSLFLFVSSAQASDFSQAYLRLDRSKANTALSGLICARPSSAGAGAEAKISVTFPNDFTINSTTANWTTSTSSLPSGASAWPGIGGSANAVSSRTVTFSGGDLTSGFTLYCFRFTAASSSTGSSGSKTGIITAKTSVNSVIDSSNFGLTILPNDQITLTATVPARSSDYVAVLDKLTAGTLFSENKEIEYRIIYSNSLTYATQVTIQASWSQGTIEGQGTPSVDILDYVVGSAGNAYASTSPVIDMVNRTITWTINSFPGNTSNETVNFRLKTNSNYKGNSKVNFTVSALINFSGGATAQSNSSAKYQNSSVASNTTFSSPTPTPSPAPAAPIIQSVDVREISKDSVSIYAQTNTATTKIIRYGKSISDLSLSVSGGLSRGSLLTLNKLTPAVKYYFRVYTTDQNNKRVTSDIYTFTTASSPVTDTVETTSLVVTSNNNILSFAPKEVDKNQTQNNVLLIPKSTSFQFKFSLKNRTSVKKIQVIVRKKVLSAGKKVLGANTFVTTAEASTEIVDVIEVEPGVYSGNLKTMPEPEDYEIIAKIYDNNGNISEQKIGDLKVVNKFTVLSKDKLPIEGARILIYIYNPTTKLYQIIPSASLSTGNPAFTDSSGEVGLVLPQGKYKAEISDLRYKDKTIKFEIGINEEENYPIVTLDNGGISILTLTRYYLRTLNDVFIYNTQLYALILTGSTRFFDLLALMTLGALAIMTLFAFSKKHHIPISGMVSYFYYLLDHKNNHSNYIHGVVYDEKDKPISRVNVYLNNKDSEQISSHSQTNRNGEFFFKASDKEKYLIMCMAKGYRTTPLLHYTDKKHLKFKITMEKEHEGINLMENLSHLLSSILGMSFEGLGIITIIFELLFINSFGLARTLPFLALSIFNLILWTLYLRHPHLVEQ